MRANTPEKVGFLNLSQFGFVFLLALTCLVFRFRYRPVFLFHTGQLELRFVTRINEL